MPGKIPAISKFKGDNSLSFRQWSLQFEAQLKALDVKNEGTKWRDLLLCCTEASAFATVSNAILADGEISYADLKHELETKYCGAEYKRTLETKLRSLVFKPGVNITTFAFEVKSVVQELYGILDGNVIDSIAQNHVLSQLDSSIQEPAKLLQLTGKCTLESLLELINSKVADNPYNIATAKASFETAATSYSSNDRVDRLEKMVEKLCFRMDEMSKGAEGLKKTEACSNCGANGHDRSRCYKLKTCYQCGMKGHISKHCRQKRENSHAPKNGRVSSSAGRMTEENQINVENGVALKPVPRIMLKLNIGGSDMDILYDPGSMYTMITRCAYDELKIKPPLVPVNRSGIGISGETFRLDGVAYLNIKFLREDGTSYILEYQPVLVSSAISSNVLGMDTELNFKGAVRDHFNNLITFVPSSGDQVVIKYWKEKKDTNTAYVHVAKATIIPAESIKMVPSKIINSKKDVLKDAPCVFEPIKESRDGLELSDVFLQSTSKVVDLPVLNDSSEDMLLSKGEVLGVINSVEQAQETIFRNSAPNAVAVHESTLSEDELSPKLQHLDEVNRSTVVRILTDYQKNLTKVPVVSHTHHEIHLKDNVPVSQPARRLPYNQRKEILSQIVHRFRVPIDILYGTFENTESNLSLQSYKDNLNSMYDTAREHMNQRQARYAAYHDKNVIDDKLSVGDYVYVYLPRLARVKLIAKWNGPFKIIRASHPVYSIEIPSNKGTLIKTITRDKLKRAPESVMNTTVLHVPTDDVTNSQSSDEIFAKSDSEEELDEPRYNLRPRRNVVRYNEELISFVTMIS
eukprot:gene6559-12057_t